MRQRRDRERVVRSRGFETQKGEGEIKRELWDFRVSGHISNSIKPYLAMYRAVLDHIEKHLGILGRVEKKKLLQTSMQPHPGYMPCPNVSNTSVATKMLYTCFPGLDHLNWSKTPQWRRKKNRERSVERERE